MQIFDARRHPQPLAVDRPDRAPVDCRRADRNCLVDAVAEPHALHERQAIRQLQAHFDSGFTVLRGWVRRGGAAHRILVDFRVIDVDATATEQMDQLIHHVLEIV